MDLVAPLRDNRQGVFGEFPFSAAIDVLGRKLHAEEEDRYAWHVDLERRVDGDMDFFFVEGWILDRKNERVPPGVCLLDEDGTVVGFAITGNPRADIADFFGSRTFQQAGFRGYVRAVDMDRWTDVTEP